MSFGSGCCGGGSAELEPAGPAGERFDPGVGDAELLAAERPRGVFSRQLILGDNPDTEHIAANYDSGVLAPQIPVAEKAKPRKISVASKGDDLQAIKAGPKG